MDHIIQSIRLFSRCVGFWTNLSKTPISSNGLGKWKRHQIFFENIVPHTMIFSEIFFGPKVAPQNLIFGSQVVQ